MDDETDTFEPKMGRMRALGTRAGIRGLKSLILARAARAGTLALRPRGAGQVPTNRFNARGRGARLAAAVPRDAGWSVDRSLGMRVRARRVTVKARVVKLAGKGPAVAAHVRYLQRDGVARDGEPGRAYSTFADDADAKAFVERGSGDRHQFRFIVSAEDGRELVDLRPFTRDLMAQVERDLGTTLDWIAIDHHDTGHPHTHILVRGKTEDGKTLNIAGDYIANGIRHRASELMTRSLGPQTERDVQDQLRREVDAERFTRLDRALLHRAERGRIDLTLADGGDPAFQQLLIARARALEAMELAARRGSLCWALDADVETTLKTMGRRGDIIRTMHHEMAQSGLDRRPELYAIGDPGETPELIGKVVRFGAAGEHHDRRFVLIDGIDGRTHYAELGISRDVAIVGSIVRMTPRQPDVRASDRTIADVAALHRGIYSVDHHLAHDPAATEAFAQTHIRRLEALRRANGPVERRSDGSWAIATDHLARLEDHQRGRIADAPWRVETLASEPLDRLARQPGPTWLDHVLVSKPGVTIADHGFGTEIRGAIGMRQRWLMDTGLAQGTAGEIRVPADLVARLRARELANVAARLSGELGLDFAEARKGQNVQGLLTRRVAIGSEAFGVVQRAKEFTLVPWSEMLDRRIGQQVGGTVRESGVNWSFGRQRSGPSIS